MDWILWSIVAVVIAGAALLVWRQLYGKRRNASGIQRPKDEPGDPAQRRKGRINVRDLPDDNYPLY